MTVCRATSDDVPQVGRTLARAFRDDPALGWATPSVERRERFGPHYFELLVERIYLPKGNAYVTEDRMAAALWAPPNQWRVSTMATLPFLPVMLRACGRTLPRAFRMLSLMEAEHKKQVEPHYYLPFIGTDPAYQRRGYGTTLLTYMLERCDAEGMAVYLEATSSENRALYHRHRFEVLQELNWPGGGPPFWPMWRKPR
jgi:ribosomal protein S18 acetylase RimI-like enzyme